MVSTSDELAPFESRAEARDAYHSDGEGSTADPSSGDEWGEWSELDVLEGGWLLIEQQHAETTETRYFLVYGPNENEVLDTNGAAKPMPEGGRFADMPAHATETDARDAHGVWLATWDGSSSSGWSEEWTEIEAHSPWYVYENRHSDGEQIRYAIGGTLEGEVVYLAPAAKIVDEMHPYESMDAVYQALEDYAAAVDSGLIDEGDQPDGGRPDSAQVARDGAALAGLSKQQILAIVVVLAIVWYGYRNGWFARFGIGDSA